jgi:hypothetical protein
MIRYSTALAMLAIAVLFLTQTNPSAAQGVILQTNPYVSYYQAPAVSYYTPPTVSYYSAPAVSYYAPPVVSYYSAPAVPYVPTTSYYYSVPAYYAAPATTVTTYRYGILPWRRWATTYVYP